MKMIRNLFVLRKLNSEFSRHAGILFIGTLLSQTIPFFVSPVLSRIYTAENYGVFSLYLSLASVFAVLATLRYENALILPARDSDAKGLLLLSLFSSLVISGITLPVMLILKNQIAALLNSQEIIPYLVWIPVTVLFIALTQIFYNWANRKKYFMSMSFSRVGQSTTGNGANILLGLFRWGHPGLIAGNLIGQAAAFFIVLIKSFYSGFFNIKSSSLRDIAVIAGKYMDFPTINLLQALTDILRESLLIMLFSRFFNPAVVGFYSFTMRILKVPVMVAATSISQVYYQKISVMLNSQLNIRGFTLKILLALILPGIPFFILLAVFSPDLFSLIFGEKWREAGQFARILTPWIFMTLLTGPISTLPVLLGRQKQAYLFSIVSGILMILTVVCGGILLNEIRLTLLILSASQVLILLIILLWYISLLKLEVKKGQNSTESTQ